MITAPGRSVTNGRRIVSILTASLPTESIDDVTWQNQGHWWAWRTVCKLDDPPRLRNQPALKSRDHEMFKKIHCRLSLLRDQLIRFWNWRKKPDHPPALTFKKRATEEVSINALKDGDVTLSLIKFPNIKLPSKERRINGRYFNKCVFSQEIIEGFTFDKCRFIECVFNGAEIVETEFHDCKFDECYFYKTKFKSTYIDPRLFSFSDKWHWDMANVNSGLFQSLYRNSKDMHQDEFAMHADRKFQFYRRYQHLRGTTPRPSRFVTSLFFDYFLGYGYGIKNTLIVTTLSIFTFAFIIEGQLDKSSGFLEAFYFTVVSFTTVGFGEITPLHNSLPLVFTIAFLLGSVAWCAVVTAIIVKRIVK